MTDVMADLSLRLRASTAEFNQKIAEAGRSVNKFGTKSKKDLRDAQKETKQSLSSIKAGFANMASGLTDQLNDITGGLSGLVGGASSSLKGVMGLSKGMHVFKVALASTGVGLIVVALGSLIAYLTQTQEGMDMINAVLEPLKAGFGAFLGVLQNVGKFIFDNFIPYFESMFTIMSAYGALLSGDVYGAIDRVKEGFSGLGKIVDNAKTLAVDSGKAMKDSLAIGAQIADLEKKIALAELERVKNRDKLKRQLKEYNDIAEDTAKSEQERINAARKSVEITKQIKALDKGLIDLQLKKLELQHQLNSTTDADRLEYAKKEAELEQQIAETIEMHTTQRNKLNILLGAQAKKQEEYNALLEFARDVTTDIANIKPSNDIANIQAPNLAMSVDIKPVTQDFTALKDVLKSTGTSFQELQAFSEGLNLMPVTEQAGLIKEKLDALVPTFQSIGSAMTSAFNQFGQTLMQAAVQGGQSLKELTETAKESAKGIIRSLIAQGVAALVKGALMNASFLGPIGMALAPGLAAAAGALATSAFNSLVPGFANGGYVPGGMTLVGERGPELVSLPGGSHVTRANKTEQLLGQANKVEVNVVGRISGQDILFTVEETQRRNGINF